MSFEAALLLNLILLPLMMLNIETRFYYCFLTDIGKGKLTVGKIYGGLLILENWKASKFGNIPASQKVRHITII